MYTLQIQNVQRFYFLKTVEIKPKIMHDLKGKFYRLTYLLASSISKVFGSSFLLTWVISTNSAGHSTLQVTLCPYFQTFMESRNRFQGVNSASLCSLAGRYDNLIPTRFLAPIDCLKIPALYA
jgi:hypothetical protein